MKRRSLRFGRSKDKKVKDKKEAATLSHSPSDLTSSFSEREGATLVEVAASLTEFDSSPPPPSSPRARYLLVLESGVGVDVIQSVVGQLQNAGQLNCEVVEEKDGVRYILVTAESNVLAVQAEQLQWSRQLKDSDEVMEFSVKHLTDFEPAEEGHFFTSAEESRLLLSAIQKTPHNDLKGLFKASGHKLEEREGFLSVLESSKPAIVSEAFPLHCRNESRTLGRMLRSSLVPFRGLNLNRIRNYFGEEVAFYFGWMEFYSMCIIVPLSLGLVMYLARGKDTTVDTDPYLPLFSVFMAVWAVLFLVCWQRRSAVHSFTWNTYSYSAAEELRPDYHGNHVIDPVTGNPTTYYPSWKRRLWYVFSFLAMLPLLLVGVAVMTLSLNLNGYVKDPHSPIFVAQLAKFAKPGGLFAADSPYYLWLVPTLAHSIIVNIINQIYSKVAVKCTDLENHRTMHRWNSSLVIKRVFFECFDCFMPLFYIAFYQLDVVTLRAEIASLFMSDEIRRVVVESLLPFLKGMFVSRKKKKVNGEGTHDLSDVALSEYDQFDDYLEMVIQFGYITLFASAFPLGAAVTFVFLYIEVRSDLFKLLTAYRRPPPMRSRDIGVWFDVMRAMVFVAILTNCAILGFSSEQLMQWLPSLFTRSSSDGDQLMAMGSGRYVVGFVFGFEHLLLVVAIWLQWAIKPTPKWVRLAISRREYLAKKRATALQT